MLSFRSVQVWRSLLKLWAEIVGKSKLGTATPEARVAQLELTGARAMETRANWS